METALFKVKFDDGREYRVFCANKSQKGRFARTHEWGKNMRIDIISNGIHTIKQWEEIINNE